MYLGEWWKACETHRWYRSDDTLRHAEVDRCLVAVFGPSRKDRGFRSFTDADLDVALAHFRRLARGLPFDADALKKAALDGERKRLTFVIQGFIREYGFESYSTILKQRFGRAFLVEELSLEQLEHLRYTLKARINVYRTHQRKHRAPVAAGLQPAQPLEPSCTTT
jgi:hypothetical protein